MKLSLTSVYVDDQSKALEFYTTKLGFQVKFDIPMGERRWLTVVSPEAPDGTQLLLEPGVDDATKAFKQALYSTGKPLTGFEVTDIQSEYKKLTALGVQFKNEPMDVGSAVVAMFDDTCGNYIQLFEPKSV